MGCAERGNVTRYARADAARFDGQGHGRPCRPLRRRRGRRDRYESRRHFDRPKTVNQILGAHIDVRHVHCHGCDRNVAAHRQTERTLLRRHYSRRRFDPARPCPGTPDEKRSGARKITCRCCRTALTRSRSSGGWRRIDSVCNKRDRPHARLCVAGSA